MSDSESSDDLEYDTDDEKKITIQRILNSPSVSALGSWEKYTKVGFFLFYS